MWSSTIILNSGMRLTWNGTIRVSSSRKKIASRPGNLSLAKAYAAAVPKNTLSTTIVPVTIVLLRKYLGNGISVVMFR